MAYRVGIIGCGGIARTHARGWRALDECELVACADLELAPADQLAAEMNIPSRYDNVDRMLERERLDIVSICTWPGSHASMTVRAAEAGARAILCEKPMACSLGEVDAMIDACAAHQARLTIGHHHRFEACNVTARRLIAEGAIGEPTLLICRVEGGLANNGSHALDRAIYQLGDVPAAWVMGQVERRTNRHERAEPCEDRVAGVIGFAPGARMILEVDTPAAAQLEPAYLWGTDGALRVDGWKQLLRLGTDGWQPVPHDSTTDQFSELLADLRGEAVHRNRAETTRRTMEALLAIYESVRVRGLVTLPLTNRSSPLRQLIDGGRLPLEQPEPYDIRIRPS